MFWALVVFPGSRAGVLLDSAVVSCEEALWHRGDLRRRVIDLIESGRAMVAVAAELRISGRSTCTWRRQARIEAGIQPGMTTEGHAELAALRERVRELETELAIYRRATQLDKGDAEPRRGSSRPSEWWPRNDCPSNGHARCWACRHRDIAAGFTVRLRRGRSGLRG